LIGGGCAACEAAYSASGNQAQWGENKVMNPIKEARDARKLTQAQLARKSSVALRTIHSVEQGNPCRQDTKIKILIALLTSAPHFLCE
jgi:DNA-binding XRE family transcriptional regulator